MRHFRLMAISIVAVCALCALAAANASAGLPEWGKCVKLPATIKGKEKKAGKGKFANSDCTEGTTGGEYEFLKGTSELPTRTFTNTMTSEKAELETSFGLGTNCTGETAHGELSGTKDIVAIRARTPPPLRTEPGTIAPFMLALPEMVLWLRSDLRRHSCHGDRE